jgi:hypothetical protein
MVPKFKIVVTQGIIHVNSVSTRQATPEAFLFYIDCKQKYPELMSCGSSKSNDGKWSEEVYLGAGEGTLFVDKDGPQDLTTISIQFEEDPGELVLGVTLGRYSIDIALIKPEDKKFEDICWWDND